MRVAPSLLLKDPLDRLETLRTVIDHLAQQGDGALALRIAPEVALLAGQIQRQNSTNAGVAAAVYSALSTAGQVMAREGHGDAAIDHVSALGVPEEQSVAMANVADLLLQRGQLELAALAAERAASAVQQMPIGTEVPLEVVAARMQARLRVADTLMQVNRQADAARVLEELLRDYRERIGRSQATGLSAATLSRSLARVGQFRLAREVANASQLNDKLVAFSVIVKEHARRSNPEIRPDTETGSH